MNFCRLEMARLMATSGQPPFWQCRGVCVGPAFLRQSARCAPRQRELSFVQFPPIQIRATTTAPPILPARDFSPLGPRGIHPPQAAGKKLELQPKQADSNSDSCQAILWSYRLKCKAHQRVSALFCG